MFDWQEIASQNGLSVDEFKKEIYSIAACVGAMDLDAKGGGTNDAMRFTCSDGKGKLELYVRRIDDDSELMSKS
jgi:hypothetical protein